MSQDGMRSVGSEARCEDERLVHVRLHGRGLGVDLRILWGGFVARTIGIGRKRLSSHIADAPFRPRISPGPADAVIEHVEALPFAKLANDRGSVGGSAVQRGLPAKQAAQGLGIMGCDHSSCERDVGEVLPEGVEFRIRRIGPP